MSFKHIVAIDFETHRICNESPYPKPICLSFSGSEGNGHTTGIAVGLLDMEKKLTDLLKNKDVLIIAHNTTYETVVLYTHFPRLRKLLWDSLWEGRWFCTQLYQQLINNVSKKAVQKLSLAALVEHYFGEDISETKKAKGKCQFSWRLSYHVLEDIPVDMWPHEAVDYSLDDSIWAEKLYYIYRKNKHTIEYKDHVIASFALNLTTINGFMVDQDKVALLKKEIHEIIDPRFKLLNEKGFATISPKTGKTTKNLKKLQEHILNIIEDPVVTPKGTVSTKKKILDTYLAFNPDDEILKTFREIADYEIAINSFVKKLEQADPVIRTQYNSCNTSGRTASSGPKLYPGIHIQGITRNLKGVTWDVRNCFVPRPGYKLCSIDFGALELSVAAHQLYSTMGYSKLRDLLNSGDEPTDPHSVTGAKIKSLQDRAICTPSDFFKNKKTEPYKKLRGTAKRVGLGKPGGLGRVTMRKQLADDGIYPKYKILHTANNEKEIDYLVFQLRAAGTPDVRSERLSKHKWALVYDEIIEFERALFLLFPELQAFLTEKCKGFETGETKWEKNDFGEMEEEPVYKYDVYGVKRDWCSYTEFCNGYLMQSPGAIGAKRAFCWATERYCESDAVILQAFIHDEILFEVKDDEHKWEHIEAIAKMMCKAMQLTLNSVRITVEASTMDYWSKEVTLEDRTYFINQNEQELRQVKS